MDEERTIQDELIEALAGFEHDFSGFIIWGFPWGEKNTELEHMLGPEDWQAELARAVDAKIISTEEAIKIAVKSGHDVGKSAFLCWLVLWAFSTKVDTRGRVTANTEKQLRTTLWVELAKWYNLFIARELFTWTATRLCSADPKKAETWRVDAIPWSTDNPTAFAGLHNYFKRIIYVFDEAAGIPDVIWEVADGVMREANTELIWACTSQPILNRGRFYECFNKFAASWICRTVDSREVKFGNKKALAQEIADRGGEEDDIVRVRIRGEFPATSMLQLIPVGMIKAARLRPAQSQSWEPLIMGVDVARFGNNANVAMFRRGRDARTIPPTRWKPPPSSNPTEYSGGIIAGLIDLHHPDAVFIDETGYGAGVVDFVRYLGHNVVGVNFGSQASTSPGGVKVLNKRAEMYVLTKDWLPQGCIPDDQDLEDELISIQYSFNERTAELKLMSKSDMASMGFPSPDNSDSLVLTFAYPVSAKTAPGPRAHPKVDYDPLGPNAVLGFGRGTPDRWENQHYDGVLH